MTSVNQFEKLTDLDRDVIDNCIYKTAKKDMQAFEQLYKLTSPSVYGFSLSFLKNTYDAEDIMHDLYINIYKSAEKYKSSGKPMAWILTIARNLCLQKLREQAKKEDVPCEDWERALSENQGLSFEDRMIVSKCMKILDDEERQIVLLHAVAGFKHRETAQCMNILLPTVLSKYNRAIKKLKNELEKESEAI